MAEASPRLRVRRRCWRVLAPRWASEPLSGAGAARHGGRFNEPGTPALYVSEDLMTAVAEYEQDLGIRPGTFCAYDIDVDGVVDLTDPAAREALAVTPEDIACPWKEIALVHRRRPPTWDLAARLIASGCAGLRAPSVRQPAGVNLVLWRWNDDPARTVIVRDPHTTTSRPTKARGAHGGSRAPSHPCRDGVHPLGDSRDNGSSDRRRDGP